MKWFLRIVLIAVIAYLCVFVTQLIGQRSDRTRAYQSDYAATLLYINGQAIREIPAMMMRDNHTFVNLALIEDHLPEGSRLAPTRNRLLVPSTFLKDTVTQDTMVELLKNSDFEINVPVIKVGQNTYLDIVYLDLLSTIDVYGDAKPYQLYTADFDYYYSFVKRKSALIVEPKWPSQTITTLAEAEKVYVLEVLPDYLNVITARGFKGYLSRDAVDELYRKNRVPLSVQLPDRKASSYSRVQYTFDHLTDYNATLKASNNEKIVGLDGLIPTFFRLTVDGWVLNHADPYYVDRAKQQGYTVIGHVDNQFDPALTHAMLADATLSRRVIDQLVFYALYYQLDGIHVDFENVNIADSALFNQFMQVLYKRFHALNLIVSIGMVRPDDSDSWSKFLDRQTLANYCDYAVLMAYDQHYASSTTAGSVAAIPWTEEAIRLTLVDVPKDKLILGVPTFVRVWREATGASGTLTSRALAMNKLDDFLERYDAISRLDSVSGQNYHEIQDDSGDTLRIWAEDAHSVKRRLALIRQYELAGIASWRRGFESSSFWRLVNEALDAQ